MRHIRLKLDGSALRVWHLELAERIDALSGHCVSVDLVIESARLPANVQRLFAMERFIYGLERTGLSSRVGPPVFATYVDKSHAASDLTIDLRSDRTDPGPGWHLDVDGVAGEAGLLASLLAKRTPVVTLQDERRTVMIGRLGVERWDIAVAAFEDCLARITTLIIAALGGVTAKALPDGICDMSPRIQTSSLSLFGVVRRSGEALARRLGNRLHGSLYRTPHWRVGWRRLGQSDAVWDLRHHPEVGWTDLPDDGLRFYADPFPIVHRGALTLFLEEYDHRIKKGVISAVAFDERGPIGKPEPVLECPHHLSYPFVFEADGEIWMVPESCSAGAIDLYRAARFPSGWVHEARLVDGVVASDATLFNHSGLWWMLATVRDGGGSYSDALYVWVASDFRGPWQPHAGNPVLVDIASARPAGRLVSRAGSIYRPVQDCRAAYGHALGLARILRLDRDAFEQRVETTLAAGSAWPGNRLHTLNAAGGFEFIDGSGSVRRRFLTRRAPKA